MSADQLAVETLFAIRELTGALGQTRRMALALLPQTWPLSALRVRWQGLDDAAIVQLARDRVGYQGDARGLLLTLDEVLAIDHEIVQRQQQRRTKPAHARKAG